MHVRNPARSVPDSPTTSLPFRTYARTDPGRCANVSESVVGTIASLEHALDSFEDRLRERETDLAQSQRQAADLAKQLEQPFEHEEKLAAATIRQQEIVTALDTTKNQAAITLGEAIETDGRATEGITTRSEKLPPRSSKTLAV